jgi:hypothetical protein
MVEGRDHSGAAYVWPSMLLYRVPHSRLVYLDLNHWIGLAKAAGGHPGGAAYHELLSWLGRSLPLAAPHSPFPVPTTWS